MEVSLKNTAFEAGLAFKSYPLAFATIGIEILPRKSLILHLLEQQSSITLLIAVDTQCNIETKYICTLLLILLGVDKMQTRTRGLADPDWRTRTGGLADWQTRTADSRTRGRGLAHSKINLLSLQAFREMVVGSS